MLNILLVCYDNAKSASHVREALGKKIRESGAVILDEVILQVDAKRKVHLHDPAKTVRGGATAALTWGLFGLVTGGILGLVIWGVIGGICGALWAYYTEHALSKTELKRIGESLPPDSSAMLAFIQAEDTERVLQATSTYAPAVATVAAVGADLSTRVIENSSAGSSDAAASANAEGGSPHGETVLSMLLFRYKGQHTVESIVKKLSAAHGGQETAIVTELAIEVDEKGKAHVHDPGLGLKYQARSSMVSWALFGLVVGVLAGLISGLVSGGGFSAGLLTGLVHGIALFIGWGIFGLAAGALYGLWVGRGISGRRLRIVAPLLPPDTSLLLAWGEIVPRQQEVSVLSPPAESERLILGFRIVEHGALLEVA
jgi:uncharacterized membrane protein